jgi:hypothetical protein
MSTRRIQMSDDQRPGRPGQQEEATDEVEAHKSPKKAANIEAGDEAESSDENDFEAHRSPKKA